MLGRTGYHRQNDERANVILDVVNRYGSRRRVLDFGANDGWLAARLAAVGHDVVAVEQRDIEPVLLDDRATGSVEWVRDRIAAAQIPSLGSFDAVLALSVLHHFQDAARAFEQLRLLARDVVIVELPDPKEGRRESKRQDWARLHDAVFSIPKVEELLWLPGWLPETRRPMVAVPRSGSR